MKKFLITLLTVFSMFSLPAQMNTDSLKKVLASAKTDSATLHTYLNTADDLESDNEEAQLLIGDWVAAQAQKNKYPYLEASAYYSIGRANLEKGNHAAATEFMSKAQAIAHENNYYKIEINSLGALANMYKQNHQYTKAIAYQQKALEASKKNNYKKGLALAYYNLGAIVHDSSDAKPRNNDAVIAYMQQAINNAQSARDTILELQFCSVIAGMYSEVNKYDSAFLYFKKAGELIKETGTEEYFATHYLFLGLNYASTKNYKEAINDFEKGISYAKKFHKPIMEYNYYTALADAYDSLRDYKNAYLYKTKYVTLHDSLLDKEKFEMATTIENKYQQVKKDNEILKLNRDKEIAAVKRKQLIAFLFASLAGLAILAILSFLLLKNIKARKKAYAQLQEKSIQIQEQALELSKQAKLIAQFQSQMNPHFVFNALHNIQGLVMSKENEKATSQIQSLAQLMRKTFANAEKDDIPLREEISYLQKYIDFEMNSFDKQLHFEVKVGDQAEDAMIPPMMIQPFVENAIKHARLKTVQNPYIKVLIEIENNLLQISVKDNGVGIRKEETRLDNLSHSMSVIKSRIELLFQEKNKPVNENLFSIKTVPDIDTGTLVRFYLPLNYSC